MSRTLVRSLVASAALAAVASPALAADNGFYLGGSVGQANTKADFGSLANFNESDTGYKLYAGFRPIDLFAVEVAYVDFGSPSASIGPVRANADTKGATAFGLVYLPLPIPLVDLYAKAGFARIDSKIDSSSFRLDRTDTNFAWGVGGQLNFGSLAVRAEYEKFKTDAGNPDLVSIGVAWTFL
jgi:opacity protein-like surface antigen